MASYKLALICLVALAVAQVMCKKEEEGPATKVAAHGAGLLHKIGGIANSVMNKIPFVGGSGSSGKKEEAAPADEKKEEGEAKEGDAKDGDAKEGDAKEGEEAKEDGKEEKKEEEKKEE